jgi:hypothetical protein
MKALLVRSELKTGPDWDIQRQARNEISHDLVSRRRHTPHLACATNHIPALLDPRVPDRSCDLPRSQFEECGPCTTNGREQMDN